MLAFFDLAARTVSLWMFL